MSTEKTKQHGISSGLLLILLSVLSFAGAASAADFRGGNNLIIPAGQAIDNDLYVGASDIRVDGDVNGDLIAAAGNIRVGGKVSDDLMLAGGTIIIDGPVGDDVRVAGGTISINSNVSKDILAAGGTVTISGNAGRDVFVGAGNIELNGRIGGNLTASGDSVVLGGVVQGNANITATKLELKPGAEIKGDLIYTSSSKAVIPNDAIVHGSIRQIVPKEPEKKTAEATLKDDVYSFLKFFIVGALIVFFAPTKSGKISDAIVSSPLKSSLLGLALLFTAPFAAILLLVTIIGIPLAIIGIMVYILAIYVSGVFVGFAIGRMALERAQTYRNESLSMLLALFIGLVLLTIFQQLPVVGGLIGFLTIILGLGAMFSVVFRREPAEEKKRARKR